MRSGKIERVGGDGPTPVSWCFAGEKISNLDRRFVRPPPDLPCRRLAQRFLSRHPAAAFCRPLASSHGARSLFVCGQDHRHGLGMDRLDDGVRCSGVSRCHETLSSARNSPSGTTQPENWPRKPERPVPNRGRKLAQPAIRQYRIHHEAVAGAE
jgi:hypothetical protein